MLRCDSCSEVSVCSSDKCQETLGWRPNTEYEIWVLAHLFAHFTLQKNASLLFGIHFVHWNSIRWSFLRLQVFVNFNKWINTYINPSVPWSPRVLVGLLRRLYPVTLLKTYYVLDHYFVSNVFCDFSFITVLQSVFTLSLPHASSGSCSHRTRNQTEAQTPLGTSTCARFILWILFKQGTHTLNRNNEQICWKNNTFSTRHPL